MRYTFDHIVFDDGDGRLQRVDGSGASTLRPQVAQLLRTFLDRPGEVLDREVLCKAVWDEGTVVDFEAGLAAVLRELRRELGRLGASEDLIETIPRRGYRINLNSAAIRRGMPSQRLRPGVPLFASVTLILVILIGMAATWFFWRPEPPPGPATEHALAILPFEQFSGFDRPPEHASLLMADYLLAELWQTGLEGVSLIGRSGIRPYRDRADVAEAVAADLGVDLLLEGSIMAVGTGWRIEVRLLEIPPGRVIWSQRLDWPERDALPVAESADHIVSSLREAWPGLARSSRLD